MGRVHGDPDAGPPGVGILASLPATDPRVGGDGIHRLDGDGQDRLSSAGRDLDYRLTDGGRGRLEALGVDVPDRGGEGTTPVRYCVDWTEQRHHLSGAVG